MTPDLFSREILSYIVGDCQYVINCSKHTESLVFSASPWDDSDTSYDLNKTGDGPRVIAYDLPDRGKTDFYLVKDVPQDSIWMDLIDMNDADAPKTLDAFVYVEKAFDCLSFLDLSKKVQDKKYKAVYFVPFESSILYKWEELSLEILGNLKEAMSIKPVLGYFYPYFLMVLNDLQSYSLHIGNCAKILLFPTLQLDALYKEMHSFRRLYAQAREAIYSIFLRPEELKLETSPAETAELYKIYAALHKISLFNLHRTGEKNEPEPESWDDFLKGNRGLNLEEVVEGNFLTLKGIILDAINSLASSNMILRKCALCGGYFKAKNDSKQICCSRLYKNTKATCYEYASRKSYKKKLNEHPVYQEYIKAYNRLYGRIRRKTIPANTPLTKKLKELRDAYYEKYDSASEKDQKGVLEEYRKKNSELIS